MYSNPPSGRPSGLLACGDHKACSVHDIVCHLRPCSLPDKAGTAKKQNERQNDEVTRNVTFEQNLVLPEKVDDRVFHTIL